MPKFGIATLIEKYPVGYEFAPDNIPLHLTHIDSFTIEVTPEVLAAELQGLLVHVKPFRVRAVRDEMFGPGKDIPVTVLELTPQLAMLHQQIMEMLTAENAVLKRPEYNGEFYVPHVSIYGDRRIKVGDEILINDMVLATKVSDEEGANHRILATMMLGVPSAR